ncbi:hypothetical protein V8C86DRAFT_463186 [Haematococcus lacustris]
MKHRIRSAASSLLSLFLVCCLLRRSRVAWLPAQRWWWAHPVWPTTPSEALALPCPYLPCPAPISPAHLPCPYPTPSPLPLPLSLCPSSALLMPSRSWASFWVSNSGWVLACSTTCFIFC